MSVSHFETNITQIITYLLQRQLEHNIIITFTNFKNLLHFTGRTPGEQLSYYPVEGILFVSDYFRLLPCTVEGYGAIQCF